MVEPVKVPALPLKDFCLRALELSGVRKDVAVDVSASLIEASLRGVDSHGIRLLPHYLRAVAAGRLNPNPKMSFSKTAPSAGILDADDTFGHAAGAGAVREAMRLAKASGLGAVAVKNSSHFGTASFFALMAARQDMIGLSFTHADSLLLSTGGRRAYLGTNPIAFAAPVEGEEPFCLDMATSITTWNKILQRRESDQSIPSGWGVDAQGRETTDAHKTSALVPAGLHKGYGLSMMVEILCGVLTGMPFGRSIVRMYADPISRKRKLGHFFCVFNPVFFMELPLFKSRMKQMVDEIRNEPPLDPSHPVMVAGDPEKKTQKERLSLGIPFAQSDLKAFRELASHLKLPFPSAPADI